MSARGKGTALVMQDGKMTKQGEMVPLEVLGDDVGEFLGLLVCGVRFMRSGCSGAQILINSECFNFRGDRKEHRDRIIDLMERAIRNLQNNGRGIFEISSPEVWEQGTVITITRRVPEQTQNMTFGEVPDGRDFFIVWNDETGNNPPEEVRCMKVTGMGVKGQYHDGIRLDQDSRRGTAIYPGPKYPVKLIL